MSASHDLGARVATRVASDHRRSLESWIRVSGSSHGMSCVVFSLGDRASNVYAFAHPDSSLATRASLKLAASGDWPDVNQLSVLKDVELVMQNRREVRVGRNQFELVTDLQIA